MKKKEAQIDKTPADVKVKRGKLGGLGSFYRTKNRRPSRRKFVGRGTSLKQKTTTTKRKKEKKERRKKLRSRNCRTKVL